MIVSRHHNVGQNQNLLVANKTFKNVAMFKYFGTTVTDQNCVLEGTKSRLNSGNACYDPAESLFPSPL
jgi:hypothetical protein